MENNYSKTIQELRTVVLDLYRQAGQLDDMLNNIELELQTPGDTRIEFIKLFIRHQVTYLQDVEKARFGNLDKRKKELLTNLLKEAK